VYEIGHSRRTNYHVEVKVVIVNRKEERK